MSNVRWAVAVACLSLGGSLVVSMVTSAAIVGRAVRGFGSDRLEAQKSLDVRGSARLRVTSDLAVWSATVRAEAPALEAAFVDVEKSTVRVADMLARHGFRDDQVSIGAVGTVTHYRRDASGNATREVTTHELLRTVSITSSDVARVRSAAADAAELLGQGVRIEANPPEYLISNLADLRVRIVGEATRDARSRANEIITNAGGSLGELRSADAGPLQVTRPDSTEVSGYGQYDTSTIDKDVSVTVSAKFGIAR